MVPHGQFLSLWARLGSAFILMHLLTALMQNVRTPTELEPTEVIRWVG